MANNNDEIQCIEDYDERIIDRSRDNRSGRTVYKKAIELKTLLLAYYIALDFDKSIDSANCPENFLKVIPAFCKRFGIDINLMKKSSNTPGKYTRYYKSIPQKYWGIVLFFYKYTYSKTIPVKADGKVFFKRSYLYYLSNVSRYNGVDEFEEQEMISDFVSALKDYIDECITTKEQYLFEYKDHMGETKNKTIPFSCMRYIEDKYICEYLQKVHNREIDDESATQIILELRDIASLQDILDDPHRFNIMQSEKSSDFITLLENFISERRKDRDFPKSYEHRDCFCTEEFFTLIENLTHSNGFNGFYGDVKNDYIDKLNKLTALIDMYYVTHLYAEADTMRKDMTEAFDNLSKSIEAEYSKVRDDFVEFVKQAIADTDTEQDEISKACKVLTKWIALNALSENQELCNMLNNNGVKIQYKPFSNFHKM